MNLSSTPPFSQSTLAFSKTYVPPICGTSGRLSRMSFPREAALVFDSEEPPSLFTQWLDSIIADKKGKRERYLLSSTRTVSKVLERRQLPRQFNLFGSTYIHGQRLPSYTGLGISYPSGGRIDTWEVYFWSEGNLWRSVRILASASDF